MSFICLFCDRQYTQKVSLERHLKKNRCTAFIQMSAYDIYKKIEKTKLSIDNRINNMKNKTNLNNKLNNKLIINYLDVNRIYYIIEEYTGDDRKHKLLLLLSEYIKYIICNKEHPENYIVKYVKKKPPTYILYISNKYKNIIGTKNDNSTPMICDIKNACEILCDPILKIIKGQIVKCYKNLLKNEFFDEGLYEIQELNGELNSYNIKRALHNVLQYYILNNIDMKVT